MYPVPKVRRVDTRRPGGPVLPGGASPPYRSIEVLEEKFAEIFGNSGIRVAGMIATRYGVLERRIVNHNTMRLGSRVEDRCTYIALSIWHRERESSVRPSLSIRLRTSDQRALGLASELESPSEKADSHKRRSLQ
jgi:hypothetical protein